MEVFNLYLFLSLGRNKEEKFEIACRDNKIEAVKYLIDKVDKKDVEDSALRIASTNGRTDIVKYLLSQGFKVKNSPLCVKRAAIYGHLETLKILLASKGKINNGLNSPILWASYYGHLHIVKYLISIGADVSILQNKALLWACNNGHKDVTILLASICGREGIKSILIDCEGRLMRYLNYIYDSKVFRLKKRFYVSLLTLKKMKNL